MYNRHMEKTLKTISSFLIVAGIIFIIALVFLRVAFPPEKIRTIIENYAKNELGRDISFDESSFRIIGVDLHNFALSEKGGFDNGTFIKTKTLSFKAKLLPLLRKKIVIHYIGAEELYADIIKKDGKSNVFNGNPVSVDNYVQSRSGKINFTVVTLEINKAQINYSDKDKNRTYVISDLFCLADGLHFDKPFGTKIRFNLKYREDVKLLAEGAFVIDLNGMDFSGAYADFNHLVLRRDKEKVNIKAAIKNFKDPSATLSAESDEFSYNFIKGILNVKAPFKFNKIRLDSEFEIDRQARSAVFEKLNLSSGKSAVKSSGTVFYAKGGKTYDFKQTATLDIEEFFHAFGKQDGAVMPSGTINIKTNIVNARMSAQAWSRDISLFFTSPAVVVSGIKMESVFKSDFDSGKIDFEKADFFMAGSTMTASGEYDFRKQDYSFFAKADADIKDAAILIEGFLKNSAPEGALRAEMTFTKGGFKAKASLTNAAINFIPFLRLSGLNGTSVIDSVYNIKISSMTGNLNGEKFTFSASYIKDLKNIALFADISAAKILIPDFPGYDEKNDTESGKTTKNPKSAGDSDIPYIVRLKLAVRAGLLELPHIKAKNVIISADMQDITPQADNINGEAALNSGEILIEDLEGLINRNGLFKTVFYPLGAVYKATEEAGISIFEDIQTGNGNTSSPGIRFTSLDAKAGFVPGFANIQKLKLHSVHSSLNAAGNIDLKTHALNMRLIIAPVLGEAFMIKLDGFLNNPKVSIDLTGSIFAVIDILSKAGNGFSGMGVYKQAE